ncbi:MAG TPA: SDR family oxidoreductase [Thermoanaerobaculia bacterium]|nr:SDR family oxidoreductase [Thermoanaerobaculia bacterium]
MHEQTALITGPARGIGAELARRLARRGMRLALVGLEPAKLAELAKELGAGHIWAECDVTDHASLNAAVKLSIDALGGLDVVVANAGIASHGTVLSTPVEALVRVIHVNLIGVIRTVKATLPHVVASKGYYLLISSASALATSPGLTTYAASKIGVEHFGNGLRVELASHGVRVGCANLSWIDTDLVRDAHADMRSFTGMLSKLPGPFSRIRTLDECATVLADAIEKRKRRVFVPKSLGPIAAVRQFFMSPLAEAYLARKASRILPQMEQEVTALGRSFGEHSAEQRTRSAS